MHVVSFASGHEDEISEALGSDGVAYIRGLGGETELLALARSFGSIAEPGVAMPTDAHDGLIYSVEVRNRGEGLRDAHGNRILSSTNAGFALHTDGFNRQHPPRYVLLLRVDESDDHAPTFVSDSSPVIPGLPDEIVTRLETAEFPSALGHVAVLSRFDAQTLVRFNPVEIQQWSQHLPLSIDAAGAVAEFGARLADIQESVTIHAGDCLVLDNSRVCHGRPELSATSRRILKRVWVDA